MPGLANSLPGQATLSHLSDFLVFFHHHPEILLRTKGAFLFKNKTNKTKQNWRISCRACNECFSLGPGHGPQMAAKLCMCPGTDAEEAEGPREEQPFPVLDCPQGTGESLSVEKLERAASPCSKLSFTQRETGYREKQAIYLVDQGRLLGPGSIYC